MAGDKPDPSIVVTGMLWYCPCFLAQEKICTILNMHERRNKQQVILLFVLLSATVSVYWFNHHEQDRDIDKNIFRDFDLNIVDEITLESGTGKVMLKYNGSRWRVNDQFAADPAMIDVLFATLQQAEPRRPMAEALKDSVAEILQQSGVKVTLAAAGTVQKSFYAGGNDSKTQAFFLEADGTQPYIMTIPGYRVYVSGIFELAESSWRDKIVFGFNWRNFQRLEISFPERLSDNFVVAMENNYFTVQGSAQVDTTRLNDFLDDVSLLSVDEYLPASAEVDSLSAVKPLVSILVTDIGKKEYSLQLYPPTGQSRPFYGLINQRQWALFQPSKIARVVRPRNFFAK